MQSLNQAKEFLAMSIITRQLKAPAKARDEVSKMLRESAIDCGYSALAAAIEGNAFERHRMIKLMRRLMSLSSFSKLTGIGKEYLRKR
jgi:hypothetical protein